MGIDWEKGDSYEDKTGILCDRNKTIWSIAKTDIEQGFKIESMNSNDKCSMELRLRAKMDIDYREFIIGDF